MKTVIYILFAVTLAIVGVAAALWLSRTLIANRGDVCKRFGLYEGRELVAVVDGDGDTCHVVEDSRGHKVFDVPVRNCILDVRYRDGLLRFREKVTGRLGYIDKNGVVTFILEGRETGYEQEKHGSATFHPQQVETIDGTHHSAARNAHTEQPSRKLGDDDLRKLRHDNPFYREAVKVLSGKLGEDDAERRRVILNYCEHFRMAYVTKDIDFIKQLFSEQALIIVGNVVKEASSDRHGVSPVGRVEYYLRTKNEYVKRLAKAFAANKRIDVGFSDFRIMRHPTVDGIYGVSLRQRYRSDKYSDDGWLFLLWDFRDEAMPCIHVRTWQPAADVSDDDDVISISDFNME